MTVEMRTTVFEIFLNGWRRSQMIQRTQHCMHPHTFLRTQIRNVLRKSYRNQNQSSTVFIFTSKQTEIAKSSCEPNWQGLLAENALAKFYFEREKFGDLITADHKVLNEESESRNNHRYAVVVQDLATQWIQSYRCKTKTLQETEMSLRKFFEPLQKKQWFMLTVHQNLENLVKIYYGIIEPQLFLFRDEWHQVKEGTSAVLLQSKLDERCWSDSTDEMSKTSWKTGKNYVWKAIWRTIQRTNTSFWSNGWSSSGFNAIYQDFFHLARKYHQLYFLAMSR